MGEGQCAFYVLWVFCPVAWKTSRNILSQGKGCVNPSSLAPGSSLGNSRTMEKVNFIRDSYTNEQEILFPPLD